MCLVKISWQDNLSDDDKDILNDVLNAMGMQAAVEQGLISQEDLDVEVARLEEKYKDVEE